MHGFDGFGSMMNIRWQRRKKNEFDKFRLIWWFIDGLENHFHLFSDIQFICEKPYAICIKSQLDHLFVSCHIYECEYMKTKRERGRKRKSQRKRRVKVTHRQYPIRLCSAHEYFFDRNVCEQINMTSQKLDQESLLERNKFLYLIWGSDTTSYILSMAINHSIKMNDRNKLIHSFLLQFH